MQFPVDRHARNQGGCGYLAAAGVATAPDGEIWFTDSAIPAYIDQLARPPSLAALAKHRPYHLYRFRAE